MGWHCLVVGVVSGVMEKLTDTTWTIRKAVQNFFSGDDLPLSVSTIQHWIQAGIFHPFSLADKCDPRGSDIDFSDIMALALLRTFFFLGMQPKDFRYYHGTALKEEGALFDGVSWSNKDKVLAGMMLFVKDQLSPEQQKALMREMEPPRRPIQTYIELMDYHCEISIFALPRARLKHQVLFTSRKEERVDVVGPEPYKYLRGEPGASITIDVLQYYKWVENKLNALK